ncbi:MAG: 30S ribosome-binding factor RbfA [Coriobacteriaceae bacterium]|nr:30S ribosome-binding factor RbfA [Coriobacteriaceae bacterium]
MKKDPTTRKAGEILRERIANAILFDVSDPRLQLITITDVQVSRDRSVAEVFVSADKDRYEEVAAGLESAKGRIRSLIGRELGWRVVPELRFSIDTIVDDAERIASTLEDEKRWQDSISPTH